MNTDKACEDCLVEMFRRVGEEYPNILTEQENWWTTRTWTSQEEDDFKEWMLDYLRTKAKMGKAKAETEVSYFLLMWGWKIK